MEEVTYITAFGVGLLTFFAPCTFATLPVFLSSLALSATGAKEGETGNLKYHLQVFFSALSYVAGFLLVFTLLGLTATSLGSFLTKNNQLLTQIGGFVIILFGLSIIFSERFKFLHFLLREKKIDLSHVRSTKGYITPFIIGITSAFAWTPCIGPILGAILFLASSTSSSAAQGAFLLFLYGLGIMLPFLLIAIFVGRSQIFVKRLSKYTHLIHRISAWILIVLGILLLTGLTDQLFGWLFNLFSFFGYNPR